MKTSQLNQIKAVLSEGKTVNSVDAFNDYRITRLASIINRLRAKGLPIITHQEKNNGVASYSLTKDWQALTLLNQTPDNKKPLLVNQTNKGI